jgi:hypothetical protein
VGPNARVKAQLGFVVTNADVVTLSNGATGTWVVANPRVLVGGVFAVDAASTGVAVPPQPAPPVPMNVTSGDPRLKGG